MFFLARRLCLSAVALGIFLPVPAAASPEDIRAAFDRLVTAEVERDTAAATALFAADAKVIHRKKDGGSATVILSPEQLIGVTEADIQNFDAHFGRHRYERVQIRHEAGDDSASLKAIRVYVSHHEKAPVRIQYVLQDGDWKIRSYRSESKH